MNRTRILIPAALLFFLLPLCAGCAGKPAAAPAEQPVPVVNSEPLDSTEAKKIALKDAGLTEDSVTDLSVTSEKEDDGVYVWEVTFRGGNYKYEYEIVLNSGRILKSEKELQPSSAAAVPSEPESSPAVRSAEEAEAIAFEHAGVNRADVTDLECELEKENGTQKYEISFDCGGMEYDYDIDAVTGTVLSCETEKD